MARRFMNQWWSRSDGSRISVPSRTGVAPDPSRLERQVAAERARRAEADSRTHTPAIENWDLALEGLPQQVDESELQMRQARMQRREYLIQCAAERREGRATRARPPRAVASCVNNTWVDVRGVHHPTEALAQQWNDANTIIPGTPFIGVRSQHVGSVDDHVLDAYAQNIGCDDGFITAVSDGCSVTVAGTDIEGVLQALHDRVAETSDDPFELETPGLLKAVEIIKELRGY